MESRGWREESVVERVVVVVGRGDVERRGDWLDWDAPQQSSRTRNEAVHDFVGDHACAILTNDRISRRSANEKHPGSTRRMPRLAMRTRGTKAMGAKAGEEAIVDGEAGMPLRNETIFASASRCRRRNSLFMWYSAHLPGALDAQRWRQTGWADQMLRRAIGVIHGSASSKHSSTTTGSPPLTGEPG